jgi:hypothetical protein
MHSFDTLAVIGNGGELHLAHLPFHQGEKVRVIITTPEEGETDRQSEYELFMKGYAEEDSVYDNL